MKLLVVAESLSARGGWGSYTAGLLRGLVALGVKPRVLLQRQDTAELPDGVQAVPCLSSPLAGLVRPQAIIWNAAQLFYRADKSQLLHFMVEPYVTASLPRVLPPSVVTLHGTYAVLPFREGRLTRGFFSAGLRRASAVVCVSRFTERALQRHLQLKNVLVIHNGHDLLPEAGAEAREQLVIDGRPVILGVGALKPRKGYHVALRAVALLRERFPDLRYYLVGDDADRRYVARLREDIATLGLERNAVITGPVPEAKLRAFYRAANLFLLTPVNVGRSFEGYGIAYLEANAHGKPVVGSLGCGAEEAVEEGVNGLLAPQNDEATIAERAGRILADPVLAQRLGTAGRARAEARTWASVAHEYLKVYEQVLAG